VANGKGLFSGVGNAKANFGANYEREGHYLMFIRRIKRDKTRKDIEFVAVEKVCMGILNIEGIKFPHRIGEQLSHLLMSDKDPFLGNMKAMIANIMGAGPEEVNEEACDRIVGDDQPMSCRIVECQNRVIQTKKGDDFTLINYRRTLSVDEIKAAIPIETLTKFLSKQELEKVLDGVSVEGGEECETSSP